MIRLCRKSRFTPAAIATSFFGALWLALAPLPANSQQERTSLRLVENFEGSDFTAESGLYYKDNAEQRAGTYRFQDKSVRHGKGALETEVTPRCPMTARKCSERAEIWERPEVLVPYHAAVWYAFSMRFDDPPPRDAHRYVVAQWKRAIKPGARIDYSPFLALRLINGQLAITVDSDAMETVPSSGALACPHDATPANPRPGTEQTRLLLARPSGSESALSAEFSHCSTGISVVARGGVLPPASPEWIDFVFKIKPGPDGDGEIEIVANGKWIASARGRIGHQGPDLGPNQYFKFGPYRDGGLSTRWRMFYDTFRRGPSCEDVADPALCRGLMRGGVLSDAPK